MFLVDQPSTAPPSDPKFELTLFRRDFSSSEDKVYSGATIKNFLSDGRQFSITYNKPRPVSLERLSQPVAPISKSYLATTDLA
jgi:hypothetical protein